jgi:hypothetical protein
VVCITFCLIKIIHIFFLLCLEMIFCIQNKICAFCKGTILAEQRKKLSFVSRDLKKRKRKKRDI